MAWLLTRRTDATHSAFTSKAGRPVISASHTPLTLDARSGEIVLRTIRDNCQEKRWHLDAAHVRTNHIHVVVDGAGSPSQLFALLKARSSQALRRAGFVNQHQPVWAGYRQVRRLTTEEALSSAIRYVLDRQGTPFHLHPPS